MADCPEAPRARDQWLGMLGVLSALEEVQDNPWFY